MSQTTLVKHPELHSPGPMTYEEFLVAEFENPHVEWVDGKIEPMAPISDAHDDVSGLLAPVLRAFVQENNLGTIRQDPFQMKTGPDLPGRAPDILFVSTANKSRLKRTYVNGPADLVIEIISPESRGRDRGDKFYEYEKGRVPEFWLIDPERKQAEFYLLRRRVYKPAELDSKAIFHSNALPGVWIDPRWFWSKPLPSVLSILRLWKLVK